MLEGWRAGENEGWRAWRVWRVGGLPYLLKRIVQRPGCPWGRHIPLQQVVRGDHPPVEAVVDVRPGEDDRPVERHPRVHAARVGVGVGAGASEVANVQVGADASVEIDKGCQRL